MSSYKDLNLNRICVLAARAELLLSGTSYDYEEFFRDRDDNPERQLKAYRLIEKIYKEIEPFINEIESDYSSAEFCGEKESLRWLDFVITSYEHIAKYVLEAEEELEPQPKKPNKPEYICILPDELIDEAVTKGSSERPKKRGRRSVTFSEFLTEKGKDMIEALHKAMKGKIGKEAALIITVAMENGLITKPAYSAVRNEFGDIGNRSGFNNYAYKLERFTKVEIEGAKRQLGL